MTVSAALESIHAKIRAALRAAGRSDEVTLVAVSKGQPESAIREAYACGQRDFGENYVQEWQGKAQALQDLEGLQWHFIGHLQRNKARLVAGNVATVQSVDGPELALELQRRMPEGAVPMNVMLEVNIASEPSKAGCNPQHAEEVARTIIDQCPRLRLYGLMVIPPATAPGAAHERRWFDETRRLADALRAKLNTPIPMLSMGMSDDFEKAVACGSTMVRVGTAIFGPRRPR